MTETLYVQLLNLACGALLLGSVLVLWRRAPAVLVLAGQGVALAGIGAVLAADQGSVRLWAVTAGLLLLRAGVLPYLLRRMAAGALDDEARPLVTVPASLLVVAVLTTLAYAVSRPLVELAPSAASQAIPVGVAVVLLGFFVLATRRQAPAQLGGILLMDNGITAVGLLTGAGLGLLVQLGLALDVLLVLLILRPLGTRETELDEVSER